MKTKVLLKRNLFGEEVLQNSKNKFFSATDLMRVGNKYRLMRGFPLFNLVTYLKSKSTEEFINEIASKYNCIPVEKTRGRNGKTWVHPVLFVDIALNISPKLKVEVYDWLFDLLVEFRNDSGDSYRKMAGILFEKTRDKSRFALKIKEIAYKIKQACKVNDWNSATEAQLKLRDKIHDNITLLADILPSVDSAVKLAIQKSN